MENLNQNLKEKQNPGESKKEIMERIGLCMGLALNNVAGVVKNESSTRKIVRFGYSSITIDNYTFHLTSTIVSELKDFWKNGWIPGIEPKKIPKKYRKEFLLYLCKAFSLLGYMSINDDDVHDILIKLEYGRDTLEQFIDIIFTNVYSWVFPFMNM